MSSSPNRPLVACSYLGSEGWQPTVTRSWSEKLAEEAREYELARQTLRERLQWWLALPLLAIAVYVIVPLLRLVFTRRSADPAALLEASYWVEIERDASAEK